MPHVEPNATGSEQLPKREPLAATTALFSTGQATATAELSTHPVVKALLLGKGEMSAELKVAAFDFLSKVSPEVVPVAEERTQLLEEQASLTARFKEVAATQDEDEELTPQQAYETFSQPVLKLLEQREFTAATSLTTAFGRYLAEGTHPLGESVSLKSNDLLRYVIAKRQQTAGEDYLIRIPVPTLTLDSSPQGIAAYAEANKDSLVTVYSPELIHRDDVARALTSKIGSPKQVRIHCNGEQSAKSHQCGSPTFWRTRGFYGLISKRVDGAYS